MQETPGTIDSKRSTAKRIRHIMDLALACADVKRPAAAKIVRIADYHAAGAIPGRGKKGETALLASLEPRGDKGK